MKEAMRAKEAVRLSVIRGIISAISNEAVTKGLGPAGELSDEEALAIIRRERNKRKDSIEQFMSGGRLELAESEQVELAILEEFLPAQMSTNDIKTVVERKKLELGIAGKAEMGKLMKGVMLEIDGRADGSTVKQVVESLLR